MENLQDLGAYCAASLTSEKLTIRPWKSITCAGTGANVPWPRQYRYVHGITDLIHVPAFTALGIKDLQNIGVSLKKIC